MIFSQNSEDIVILQYFKDSDPSYSCLSIGENDGIHLSNVLALIMQGWEALLVEPSPKAFSNLQKRHSFNSNVQCLNVAVISKELAKATGGKLKFYDSGEHLGNGVDSALLSTICQNEMQKWASVSEFHNIEVNAVDLRELLNMSRIKTFNFISIDCEGCDLDILRQMNLRELECSCLCIEHNGNKETLSEVISICNSYGLSKELLRNHENIILAL